MSARFALDTNIVSEGLRPEPDPGIVRRLREHYGECVIPAPVWHELLFGVSRLSPSRRRRELEAYLFEVLQPRLPVVVYDGACAAWHAGERARLVAAGRTPAFVDGQIAAIAVVNELVLVTRNVRDFAEFADLQIDAWD